VTENTYGKNVNSGNLHRHYRLSTAQTTIISQQHLQVSVKNKGQRD